MMTLAGELPYGLEQDEEGHRTYRVKYLVNVTDEGPAEVSLFDQLPVYGDTYSEPGGDHDDWAWCRSDTKIEPWKTDDERVQAWAVTRTFSTKPQVPNKQRCGETKIEDPLLEPPKVSGSYVKEKEAVQFDRFGNSIVNSAHEPFRGPQVEFDMNRPTIKIEQNVASPYLAYVLPGLLDDCVNAFPIWGFPPRTVKLSTPTWDRKYYGTCLVYYTRVLEFEINKKTWDRWLQDEGTKVLAGDWILNPPVTGKPVWQLRSFDGRPPDSWNPEHFIRFVDLSGNPARVILNGNGLPSGVKVTASGTSALYKSAVMALVTSLGAISGQQTAIATAAPGPAQQAAIATCAGFVQNIQTNAQTAIGASTFQTTQVRAITAVSTAYGRAYAVLTNPASTVDAIMTALDAASAAGLAFLNLATGSGSGTSANETGEQGSIFVQYYDEADFLQLGVPTDF